MRLSKLIGLPLLVSEGTVKAVRVTIPWSRLWTTPIEVRIENIDACCRVSGQYSQDFAEDMLIQYKQAIVNKIMKEVKEAESKSKSEDTKSGLFYGYIKTILDNIKIKLTNVHLRIEDIGSSIKDCSFSFGIRCNLLEYGYFTKKSDAKQASGNSSASNIVPKLVINGLSVYWDKMDSYTGLKDIVHPLNICVKYKTYSASFADEEEAESDQSNMHMQE